MHAGVGPSPSVNRRAFMKRIGAASLLTCSPQLLAGAFAAGGERAPARDVKKKLIFRTRDPHNAEPELEHLLDSWITPLEYFYIRSHAPSPQIDAERFRLSVEGLVHKPQKLSLDELHQEFKQLSVVATMTCAGNRRSEHSRNRPVEGVQWDAGAIGNARWTGLRLSDLLKRCGLKENARHVWFEGLDEIDKSGKTIPFGGSIAIEKAMADGSMPGALVATGMNDGPLPVDHGYPVRMVIPGYIGARSVKWLGRIVVSDRPSPNHYLQDAYKLVDRDEPLARAEAGPIYRFPLNSAICIPQAGAKLKAGKTSVAGYALPAGTPETTVSRVEVSADGGRSWVRAKLDGPARAYCWQIWRAEVPVEARTTELVVRAVDSNDRVQPRRAEWNVKGYLYNGWHRIPVRVEG